MALLGSVLYFHEMISQSGCIRVLYALTHIRTYSYRTFERLIIHDLLTDHVLLEADLLHELLSDEIAGAHTAVSPPLNVRRFRRLQILHKQNLAYSHLKLLASRSPMFDKYKRNSGMPKIAYIIVATLPWIVRGETFP